MKADCLIIPRSWYQDKKLTNENGRSDWLAITILAELEYLATAGDSLKEMTFNGTKIHFSKLYGSSIVCVRRALKRLQKNGFIYFAKDKGIRILKLNVVTA